MRTPRSASTSSTRSARRASSRRSGVRTASARSPTPRSSRATSSRRGASSRSPRRTSSKVRPESTRLINLTQFTTVDQIDPIYFERPYYLAPDGNVAAEAFAVDPRGHAGQGRHRQARPLRPRVHRRRPAAREGAGDVHAAVGRRGAQHVADRGTRRRAGQTEARRGQARAAGDRDLRGRPRHQELPRHLPGGAAAASSTPRWPAKRSSRPKKRRRPRSWT